MRAVIQRVSKAKVSVGQKVCGEIQSGLLVFLGIGLQDEAADVDWLSRKILHARLFENENGTLVESVLESNRGLLVVSQFTLFANLRKGTRPSFHRAAPPTVAEHWYDAFCLVVEQQMGRPVAQGQFGGKMKVEAHNDGPLTLLLDSQDKGL